MNIMNTRPLLLAIVLLQAARLVAAPASARSLPGLMPAPEFALRHADEIGLSSEQQTVLQRWYRRDDNAVPPQHVFGLFQPPMPCGVGACQACLVRRNGEEVPACLEGPAFDLLSLNVLLSESSG